MTGIKVVALGSLISVLGLAQQSPLLNVGQTVGTMTTAAFMGLCIVVLAYVVKKLDARGVEREAKLETLIEEIAKVAQESNDASRQVSSLMVEVKDSNNNVAAALQKIVAHCSATLKR